MSNGEPQSAKCPSCRGEMEPGVKRCSHCGRPMGPRGFFFYAFWIVLSMVTVALIGEMFYCAFLMVNRML